MFNRINGNYNTNTSPPSSITNTTDHKITAENFDETNADFTVNNTILYWIRCRVRDRGSLGLVLGFWNLVL